MLQAANAFPVFGNLVIAEELDRWLIKQPKCGKVG